MHTWTAVARHRLFCQCSDLARLKPLVQKLYGHGALTNIPHLSAARLVQAHCHISVLSRPGLTRVQSSRNSRCFSEAISCGYALRSFVKAASSSVGLFNLSYIAAITEELAARVAYRYQSALQVFVLRLSQCLKDWAAFLRTSNCKLGRLIWFGKQILDFFSSLRFFLFCVN